MNVKGHMRLKLRRLRVVAAFVAGAALAAPLGALATSGGATGGKGYILYPHDTARFAGLDWTCPYIPSPSLGRVVVCGRSSTINGITVDITGASVKVYKIHRISSSCCSTLLFRHARNP